MARTNAFPRRREPHLVIPAQAGIQCTQSKTENGLYVIPAQAGIQKKQTLFEKQPAIVILAR